MIILKRSDSLDPDFISLVRSLDADLAVRDGNDHAFYAQFNKIDQLRHVVVAYIGEKPMGCGALKPFLNDAAEVKRMYVSNEGRRRGVATHVLAELEKWAKELGFSKCILETGRRQPEAIALYKKNGYLLIGNYGQYAGIANSVCFQKVI